MKRSRKARKYSRVEWNEAGDIKKRVITLSKSLGMNWIRPERIFFYRSEGSKSRAYARTWGLPSLWQRALEVEPGYIIEVISHYFDNLPKGKQDEVLLHELTHIPRNFSGALVPHTRHKKGSFRDKLINLLREHRRNKNS